MAAEFTIEAENVGRRLETVVVGLLADVPRSRLMKWWRTGKIRLNGGRTRPRVVVALGDCIRLPFDPAHARPFEEIPQTAAAPRRLPPPDVLFEDDDLLLVNKPAHLASHPGMLHNEDSLVARILGYLNAHQAPVGKKPGLAQRLDAGVTGIVPCGKHAVALRALSGPPHGPALEKVYLALVDGNVALDAGSIMAPLRVTDAPMGNTPKAVVDEINGQHAHTDYTVVQRLKDVTLVRITLKTGRTHQIRAHMRHLGHAILGDPRYGLYQRNAYLAESFGVDRPLLHAAELTLQHPTTGETIFVAAPMPKDMARIVAGFAQKAEAKPA